MVTYTRLILLLLANSVVSIAGPRITSVTGGNGDGGQANATAFHALRGVAYDAAGNAYLAEGFLNAVRKIGANGVLSTIAGAGSQGLVPLRSVRGVAVDAGGNLYIADSDRCVVRRVTPSGSGSIYAGTESSCLSSGDGGPAMQASISFPGGLAFDNAGNLYVTERSGRRVRRVTAAGIISTVAGNGSPGQTGDGGPARFATLFVPEAVATDNSGNIYIGDASVSAIRRVSTTGVITRIAGNGFAFSPVIDGSLATAVGLGPIVAMTRAPDGNLVFSAGGIRPQVLRLDLTNNTLRVLAGTGSGFGIDTGDGGPATAATFSWIDGLAYDPQGNLVIGTSSGLVRRVDSQGVISTIAGGAHGFGLPATSVRTVLPDWLAVSPNGSLTISGSPRQYIRQIQNGTMTRLAGNGLIEVNGPPENAAVGAISIGGAGPLAYDAGGSLFYFDYQYYRLYRVSPSGVVTTVGGNGIFTVNGTGDGGPAMAASLGRVRSLAVAPNGDIFLTAGNSVRRLTPGGNIVTVAGTGTAGLSGDGGPGTNAQLRDPEGLVLDDAGNLYVADTSNSRVRRLSSTGIISTFAGTTDGFRGDGGQATAAQLRAPFSLAWRNGSLFIADYLNHRVRRVNPAGVISTYAGGGPGGFLGGAYAGDGGPAELARLNRPWAIQFDTAGNLYIADTGNARIRKVEPEGQGFTPPSPRVGGPLAAGGVGETLTFRFSHPDGAAQMGIVNILVNQALDGNRACYIAYSQPDRVLYLVKDSGPDEGLLGPLVLGSAGAVSNSQCTIQGAQSSAVVAGNELVLTLRIEFAAGFRGSKVIYTAAGTVANRNSGWNTLGAWQIPEGTVTYPRTTAMSPATVSTASQVVRLEFEDATSSNNILTGWALINTAVDAREACYVAYFAPANLLFLIPDDGDGARATSIELTGTNAIENSQCRVSAAGSSVVRTGNKLQLSLNLTMKPGFLGPKGIWTALQTTGGAVSPWRIAGSWLAPEQ